MARMIRAHFLRCSFSRASIFVVWQVFSQDKLISNEIFCFIQERATRCQPAMLVYLVLVSFHNPISILSSNPTLFNSLDLRSITTTIFLELLFGVLFLVALLEAFYYSFDRFITRVSREMANQQHEAGGLNWPPRRLLFIHRRGLIIASLVAFTISVMCFVGVATIETAKLERRALAERQFQLGGFLGGMLREVMRDSIPTAHRLSI